MYNQEWIMYLRVLRGTFVAKAKGKGRGHWGHKGRKGKRGGSLPSKGARLDREFATSPVGKTILALNKDYDFVLMGSAAMRLHLGEDLGRIPKDVDVLDLRQKREDTEGRWVDLSDPRSLSRTEMQDRITGTTVQHYESGQIMDTVRGIRAPTSYQNTETIAGVKVLRLKSLIDLKSQTDRPQDEQDVIAAIKVKNLPRDYLGKHIGYWVLWEEAHGIL